MSWINDILNRAGQPFRNFLDNIRADVNQYCWDMYKELSEQGATLEEIHAIVLGFYEVWTEGNPLQYLYLNYIEDWFDEVEE